MTANYKRSCRELDCEEHTNRWRQCPHKDCSLEIAFCTTHGNDSRAVKEMQEHVASDHKSKAA